MIKGRNRVIRGGSWNNNARNCRPDNRNNNPPGNANNNLGFRLSFPSKLMGMAGQPLSNRSLTQTAIDSGGENDAREAFNTRGVGNPHRMARMKAPRFFFNKIITTYSPDYEVS
jgi:hypothetical protein